MDPNSIEASPSVTALTVAQVVRDLVDTLAPGTARVELTSTADGIVVLNVVPNIAAAARIVANVESSGFTTLVFGEGAVFEIPSRGHRYTRGPLIEEIKSLCTAAIEGRVAETVWKKNGEIVRAKARVNVGGKIVRSSWYQLFPKSFIGATKIERQYQPYAGRGST